jgi:chromosome segregation ATPase
VTAGLAVALSVVSLVAVTLALRVSSLRASLSDARAEVDVLRAELESAEAALADAHGHQDALRGRLSECRADLEADLRRMLADPERAEEALERIDWMFVELTS